MLQPDNSKALAILLCADYPLEDVPLGSLAECTFKAANDGDKVRVWSLIYLSFDFHSFFILEFWYVVKDSSEN